MMAVRAGGDQGAGIDLLALLFDVGAQDQLGDDGHGDDHQRNHGVFRLFGMDDLLDGLHRGGDAGVQHDAGDDHGAQVLDASVAEGVLLIGQPARQLGADDGDDGGQGVGQVVDRVQDHGDRVGDDADARLEGRQEYVGQDADDAGADDDAVTALGDLRGGIF